ncbi:unnamed protein product [Symbiodinium sp. CCMP2592]|nr:unnamed protein product [Symbiodinium sp. CCMP2592]
MANPFLQVLSILECLMEWEDDVLCSELGQLFVDFKENLYERKLHDEFHVPGNEFVRKGNWVMTQALSFILKSDCCSLGYSMVKHDASGACSEAFLLWLHNTGRDEHFHHFIRILNDLERLIGAVHQWSPAHWSSLSPRHTLPQTVSQLVPCVYAADRVI